MATYGEASWTSLVLWAKALVFGAAVFTVMPLIGLEGLAISGLLTE